MTIFDKFSDLDPVLARKRIEVAHGSPVFDQYSHDPARAEAQMKAALSGIAFDHYSLLDPSRERAQIDAALAGNPYFYNFTGSNLPNWKAAKAAVLAGTRNATLIAYGDSTTAGFGSVSDGATNCIANSYPTQLAALLPNASWSSFTGNHAGGSGNDARVAAGSWSVDTNPTLGAFAFGTSSSTPFTFTPTNPIDTIEVWSYQNPGLGSFTISVDGGAPLATVSEDNTPAKLFKSTVTVALGVHAIQIARVSGPAYLHTIRAYNSAAKEISVMNAGASGWNSTQLADGSIWLSPLTALQDFTPDLTLIEGGIINDWCQGISLVTSQANLQAMITAAKRSGAGDAILISPVPSEPGQVDSAPSYVVQQTYVDMMHALAISNGIPMIDVWRLFGGTFQSSLMFNDAHENGAGYSAVAGYCNAALS